KHSAGLCWLFANGMPESRRGSAGWGLRGWGSVGGGVGWHPGPSDDGVVEGGHYVVAVFGGGGQVAADGVAVLGPCLAGEPPGDCLLDFAGPQVAFGLV